MEKKYNPMEFNNAVKCPICGQLVFMDDYGNMDKCATCGWSGRSGDELLEKWHRMQKKLPYRLESKAWHESLLQRFCGRIYAQVRFHRMLHNIRGKRELFYPDPKT